MAQQRRNILYKSTIAPPGGGARSACELAPAGNMAATLNRAGDQPEYQVTRLAQSRALCSEGHLLPSQTS